MRRKGGKWRLWGCRKFIDSVVEDIAAVMVPLKPARLTGNEIRFLRRHLGESQESFGRKLSVTRKTVNTWEQTGDNPTPMEVNQEKVLRLFVLNEMGLSEGSLKKALEAILGDGAKVSKSATGRRIPHRLDASIRSREQYLQHAFSS